MDKTELNIITGKITTSNYSAAALKLRSDEAAALKIIDDIATAEALIIATAKAALLARLGITADEAKLLIG